MLSRVEYWGLALALAAPGVAIAADQAGPPDMPSAYTSEKVSYDEVGYAGGSGSAGVSASHPSLEVGSYAEVTDLDSGRTILVQVAGGGAPAGRMVGLSDGALRQLGLDGRDAIPVRVRRVNPPEFERVALGNGQTAKERLETPPALLSALRKRLAGQPVPRRVVKAPAKPVKMPTRPIVRPAPPKPAAGVDFDTAKAPPRPSAAPPPRETSRPHWDEKVMSEGGEEFIVEQAEDAARTIDRPRPPRGPLIRPRPAPAPAPQPAASGGWYVQVAAFASAANARATASRVGGGIAQAGNIYRVRTGPYASEGAARAALGGLAAKGYRGARITR